MPTKLRAYFKNETAPPFLDGGYVADLRYIAARHFSMFSPWTVLQKPIIFFFQQSLDVNGGARRNAYTSM